MIIPSSLFPEGSEGGKLYRSSDIITLDHYNSGKRWGEGLTGSNYIWMRYGTFNQAEKHFTLKTIVTKGSFTPYSINREIQDVLSFKSEISTHYWVSCGDYLFEHYSCMFRVVYGENIIYFSSNVSENGDHVGEEMGVQEFLAIISYIDTVIAPRLLDINE